MKVTGRKNSGKKLIAVTREALNKTFSPSPRINVGENDDVIFVEAGITGLKPWNIKVTLDENVLSIKGFKQIPPSRQSLEARLPERLEPFNINLELPGRVLGNSTVDAFIQGDTVAVILPKLSPDGDDEVPFRFLQ